MYNVVEVHSIKCLGFVCTNLLHAYTSFFASIPLASHRDSGRSDEKIKDIKVKYERQLTELKSELKTLKSARKEHAKAMKKNVSSSLIYQWTLLAL